MKVLVVSPHPDDETLGAGGTIKRFIDEGNEVYWLNITTAKGNNNFSHDLISKIDYQIKQIEKIYNYSGVFHLNLPTTKLSSIDDNIAIERIGKIIKNIQPNIMILPDYNDAHSDHKKVFDWCFACTKVFRYPSIKEVMTMEIVSETDYGRPENNFVPNYFVDITEYINHKINALKIYTTEIGEPPFPRSIENVMALATLRGGMSGVRYAEGFRLIKKII